MRGLAEIIRMNELEAAKALRERYKRLRSRALRRGDFVRAKRYDGYVQDFTRFLSGEIRVFPGPRQRKAGLFVPSAGRDFTAGISYPEEFKRMVLELDQRSGRLASDLAAGLPVDWWFEPASGVSNRLLFDYWKRRQFEELRGYYRLLTENR